jgi:hypothetical protein
MSPSPYLFQDYYQYPYNTPQALSHHRSFFYFFFKKYIPEELSHHRCASREYLRLRADKKDHALLPHTHTHTHTP